MAYDAGLADRIRSVLERTAKFEEKKMFGGVAFMVNARMCCGVIKTNLVLKLGAEGAEAALRKKHTRPMDFTGKPMKALIYVEPPGVDKDEALDEWIRMAVGFAKREDERTPRKADANAKNKRPIEKATGL